MTPIPPPSARAESCSRALTATLNQDNTWPVKASDRLNFAEMFDERRRLTV
jgi:hypothetical protein